MSRKTYNKIKDTGEVVVVVPDTLYGDDVERPAGSVEALYFNTREAILNALPKAAGLIGRVRGAGHELIDQALSGLGAQPTYTTEDLQRMPITAETDQ